MATGHILSKRTNLRKTPCVVGAKRNPSYSQLLPADNIFYNGRPDASYLTRDFRCLISQGDVALELPLPAAQSLQTPEAVSDYIGQQPLLKELLGISVRDDVSQNYGSQAGGGQVLVSELSGGRINFVFRVAGPAGQFVLKYAAPFVRSIGPDFQLSQTRLCVEAEAMAAAHAACPQQVPALLFYDPAASVLVQELILGPHGRRRVKLVDALMSSSGSVITAATAAVLSGGASGMSEAGATETATPKPTATAESPTQLSRLAVDLASLLSGYLLQNSVYELPHEQHTVISARLRNSEVAAANAAVVFIDPWDVACERNRVPPGLEDEVANLRSKVAVQGEVARLLNLYLSSTETLTHNDLTAGNILVPEPSPFTQLGAVSAVVSDEGYLRKTTPPSVHEPRGGSNRTRADGSRAHCEAHLIDWEFARYGPMSFDIGSLLGNLLLSYCATCCGPTKELRAAAAAATMKTRTVGGGGGCEEAAGGLAAALPLRAPLLRCIVELWSELEIRIGAYSPAHAGGSATMDGAFMEQLFSDSLGYAGCVMSRLVFGMHHYPALEAIPCGRRRRSCQRLALRLAEALLHPQERMALNWASGDDGESNLSAHGISSSSVDSTGSSCSRAMRRLMRDVERWAERAGREETAGQIGP